MNALKQWLPVLALVATLAFPLSARAQAATDPVAIAVSLLD